MACARCGAVLRRWRAAPLLGPLAFGLAALAFDLAALLLPLVRVDIRGQQRETTLLDLPFAFYAQGYAPLALLTFAIIVALPLLRRLTMLAVLVGLHLARPPVLLPKLLRWEGLMRPWAMTEVFAIGLGVAFSQLSSLAQVAPDTGLYALAALLLAGAAADGAVDRVALWQTMDRRGLAAAPPPPAGDMVLTCEPCGQISGTVAGAHCPRCAARLEPRRPQARARAAAFGLAAALLYVPANLLPAMTITQLGSGEPHTILGGVHAMVESGNWPLAVIVFAASVGVPVVKLLALGAMLLASAPRPRRLLGLRRLTGLYRMIDVIGRWSMIDLFVLGCLVAMVQAGALANVVPGAGAVCFASVVVLTMLATESFDPRLMWDAKARDR